MNGYGYQCQPAPRISVNATHASGNSSDSQATRADVSRRGPNTSQPATARIGTAVCTSWLPS